MNKERLDQVFSNYIINFEKINNKEHNENYKWRVAYKFHDLMNTEHKDFVFRMQEACSLSSNLLDSASRYCFSALVKCAKEEPESVKKLFQELFADDGGDLKLRQRKIDVFIEDSNNLIKQCVSDNAMFMNDQRSAMAYLFFNDPDSNYLYKASEAAEFASCIDFYDDWGPGTDFRLDVYYKMCDMLVEEIKLNEELIKTHKSRYIDKSGNQITDMHKDSNYHILAFDIIYGAPEFRYNFFLGIPFSNITAKARKLHQERVAEAKKRLEAFNEAKAKADLLSDAKDYFSTVLSVGMEVRHKTFGIGKIIDLDRQTISVKFNKTGETKSFSTLMSFAGGFLAIDNSNIADKIKLYKTVAGKDKEIEINLRHAETELEEYSEYLD